MTLDSRGCEVKEVWESNGMVTRQEVVDVYIFKPDKAPSRPKRGYVPGDPTVKDVSIIAPKPERRADVLAAYLNRTIAFSFSSDDIQSRKRVQSKRDAEVVRVKKHLLRGFLAERAGARRRSLVRATEAPAGPSASLLPASAVSELVGAAAPMPGGPSNGHSGVAEAFRAIAGSTGWLASGFGPPTQGAKDWGFQAHTMAPVDAGSRSNVAQLSRRGHRDASAGSASRAASGSAGDSSTSQLWSGGMERTEGSGSDPTAGRSSATQVSVEADRAARLSGSGYEGTAPAASSATSAARLSQGPLVGSVGPGSLAARMQHPAASERANGWAPSGASQASVVSRSAGAPVGGAASGHAFTAQPGLSHGGMVPPSSGWLGHMGPLHTFQLQQQQQQRQHQQQQQQRQHMQIMGQGYLPPPGSLDHPSSQYAAGWQSYAPPQPPPPYTAVPTATAWLPHMQPPVHHHARLDHREQQLAREPWQSHPSAPVSAGLGLPLWASAPSAMFLGTNSDPAAPGTSDGAGDAGSAASPRAVAQAAAFGPAADDAGMSSSNDVMGLASDPFSVRMEADSHAPSQPMAAMPDGRHRVRTAPWAAVSGGAASSHLQSAVASESSTPGLSAPRHDHTASSTSSASGVLTSQLGRGHPHASRAQSMQPPSSATTATAAAEAPSQPSAPAAGLAAGQHAALLAVATAVQPARAAGLGGGTSPHLTGLLETWQPPAGVPSLADGALRQWLFDPAHIVCPYPTISELNALATHTGCTTRALERWFAKARPQLWAPVVRTVVGKPGSPTVVDSDVGASSTSHLDVAGESTASLGLSNPATRGPGGKPSAPFDEARVAAATARRRKRRLVRERDSRAAAAARESAASDTSQDEDVQDASHSQAGRPGDAQWSRSQALAAVCAASTADGAERGPISAEAELALRTVKERLCGHSAPKALVGAGAVATTSRAAFQTRPRPQAATHAGSGAAASKAAPCAGGRSSAAGRGEAGSNGDNSLEGNAGSEENGSNGSSSNGSGSNRPNHRVRGAAAQAPTQSPRAEAAGSVQARSDQSESEASSQAKPSSPSSNAGMEMVAAAAPAQAVPHDALAAAAADRAASPDAAASAGLPRMSALTRRLLGSRAGAGVAALAAPQVASLGPGKASHRPTIRHGLQPAEYNQLAKRYAEAVAGSIGSSDFSWSNHDQSNGGSSRSRSNPHSEKPGMDRMPPTAADAAHLSMGTSAAVLNAATFCSDHAAQARAALAAPAAARADKRSRDDGERPETENGSTVEPEPKRQARESLP